MRVTWWLALISIVNRSNVIISIDYTSSDEYKQLYMYNAWNTLPDVVAKWLVLHLWIRMTRVRTLEGHLTILPITVLPAGLGPTPCSAFQGMTNRHCDGHANVNRNPSQDHCLLVWTELWPTTYFQVEFHESSRGTTRTSSSRIVPCRQCRDSK